MHLLSRSVKFCNAARLARFLLLCLGMLGVCPSSLNAQSKPQFPRGDAQVWTDFEAAHAIKEDLRLQFNGGLRYGDDAGHLIYRRAGVGFSYTWRKHVIFSPVYNFYSTDSTPVTIAHENRLALGVTLTTSLGKWGLSDRNQVERRFLPTGNTMRYRNRVQVERAFKVGGQAVNGFVWDEVFYDSGPGAWTRNRAAIGVGKTLSRRLAVDVYYSHQNDGHSHPGDLNGIGVILKTHF